MHLSQKRLEIEQNGGIFGITLNISKMSKNFKIFKKSKFLKKNKFSLISDTVRDRGKKTEIKWGKALIWEQVNSKIQKKHNSHLNGGDLHKNNNLYLLKKTNSEPFI